ncbi:MAG TPA: hypothetical protein VEK79_22580 [Thermoanaerobaculia bacterium]|nr:hypothetical protein [Thermoanaerobaculia bacterium]
MTLTDAERRTALETERSELMLRIADWSERVQHAGRRTIRDYLFPIGAGCLAAVVTVMALVFSAMSDFANNPDTTKPPPGYENFSRNVGIACVVAAVAIAAIVYLIRRMRRMSRVTETNNTYQMAVVPMQQRLREIDELLHRMDSE